MVVVGVLLCVNAHAKTLEELIESSPLQKDAVYAYVKSGLSEGERARFFAQFIIQSMNTNTSKTMRQNYLQAFEVFGASLQKDAKPYIDRKIKMGEEDGLISLWIPESRDLPIVTAQEKGVYKVSEKGLMTTIVKGLRSEVGVTVDLEFKVVPETPANPYGFELTKVYEKMERSSQATE
jgi:hypothetical protein